MAKGKQANYHGSSKETGRIHGGEHAGAGELGCGDPGRAAMKVKPRMSGLPFEGGENSYKPKGMKTYNQE
jgi:hypothetical protein